MKSTRRAFLSLFTSGVAATAGITLLGCGDDDGSPGGSGGTGAGGGAGGSASSSSGTGGGGTGGGGTGGTATGGGGGAAGGGGQAMGACQTNGTTSSISANHGHQLLVSKEDVIAGAEKAYDIAGGGNHSHMVTVTAAHFSDLASDQVVTITSTTGSGHTHEVTIQCA